MAAVLDVKGTIVRKTNKQRKTPQIVLVVDSRHEPVINRLCEMTGTNPGFRAKQDIKKWMRKGCTDHCPEAHIHVTEHQDSHPEAYMMPASYRWTITGAGMAVVFYNVLPFMTNRRDFNDAMQEAIDNTPLTGQGSGMVFSSLRRLEELGWDLPEIYEKIKDEIAE